MRFRQVLSHGNVSYLMIATAACLLLEGRTTRDGGSTTPFEGWHRPLTVNRLSLMEAHHVDPPIAAVYDNIKATFGLLFVNSDCRAFARWPSYFALA
ncbi:MAG: hypothetical protein VX075_12080 [Pseudomonadota bacterium]|nr:hypothetical protein [Pseudomonadota bacterium]